MGNQSLDSFYGSFIAQLGIQTQNAKNSVDTNQIQVDQTVGWRQSVSGVSLDEEMTNMLKFQKSYNAAARVTTTLDSMLDKLINETGRTGRLEDRRGFKCG